MGEVAFMVGSLFVLSVGSRRQPRTLVCHHRGSVAGFLRTYLRQGADLAFVSAYFTIYAYEKLRIQLDQIGELRFLFGEPRFVSSLDPSAPTRRRSRSMIRASPLPTA